MNVVPFDRKMAAAGDDTENADLPKVTFEDFWRAYPRRVAKKDAQKAWLTLKPEQHQMALAGIERARKTDDWRRDGGRYIPYPATYLRGERWEDEIETDMTMGTCRWNCNGNREPGRPQCDKPGSREKNGVVYCEMHARMVN